MIEKSELINNLASALLKAQKAIGVAIKDAKNPYFKSNYADLKAVIDSVKEPLNNNGIAFLQAVNKSNGSDLPVVETMLLHESGQFLNSVTPVFCAKPNDPQAFGSGVTYSKRYALQAILGLPTADDDAEKAMDRNGKTNEQPKKIEPPQGDVTKLIDQEFFNYSTEHGDELAKGFIFDGTKFKEALRQQYTKLTPAKKKSFEWTAEKIKTLSALIQSKDVIVEVK